MVNDERKWWERSWIFYLLFTLLLLALLARFIIALASGPADCDPVILGKTSGCM